VFGDIRQRNNMILNLSSFRNWCCPSATFAMG
jgi:hypothetical protein